MHVGCSAGCLVRMQAATADTCECDTLCAAHCDSSGSKDARVECRDGWTGFSWQLCIQGLLHGLKAGQQAGRRVLC